MSLESFPKKEEILESALTLSLCVVEYLFVQNGWTTILKGNLMQVYFGGKLPQKSAEFFSIAVNSNLENIREYLIKISVQELKNWQRDIQASSIKCNQIIITLLPRLRIHVCKYVNFLNDIIWNHKCIVFLTLYIHSMHFEIFSQSIWFN